MRKYDNTRIVVFKEDYNPAKQTAQKAIAAGQKVKNPDGRVLYKKGERAAIHHEVLDKIKDKGAKFEVVDFDFKGAEAKAREERKKAKKKANAA